MRWTRAKESLEHLHDSLARVCAEFARSAVKADSSIPLRPRLRGVRRRSSPMPLSYPLKVSVSALLNNLTGVSSQMIRKKQWGGAPIEVIRQY